MRKIHLFLSFFTVMLLSLNVSAESGSCGDNCQYTITLNNTDIDNPTYTLTIEPIDATKPASVKEYIRSCGGGCYTNAPWSGNSSITTLDIRQGITDIGTSAFANMGNTTRTLILPEGLETIGGLAFHGFRATSVTLPSTLKRIDNYAFDERLEEINGLPEGLEYIGSYAFANSKLTELVIPENVTSLSPYAFGNAGTGWNRAQITTIYCSEAQHAQCDAAVAFRGDNTIVTTYGFENGVYQIDGKLYTSADNMQKDILRTEGDTNDYTCGTDLDVCKATVLKNKGLCADIASDCAAFVRSAKGGQLLKLGSKTYQSLDALLKGDYDVRRIYTIEEANFVAGPVNRVSIKYR